MAEDSILENCRKNLEKGRAVATGIGVFIAMKDRDGKILLRTREEKDSLYGQDLSGKWELVGGGVEIGDFADDLSGIDFSEVSPYQKAVYNAINREVMEEAGLKLRWRTSMKMQPAWLSKGGLIDLAFVLVVRFDRVDATPEFKEKQSRGLLKFFSMDEVEKLNIVSPRMRFLINQAFLM